MNGNLLHEPERYYGFDNADFMALPWGHIFGVLIALAWFVGIYYGVRYIQHELFGASIPKHRPNIRKEK